MPLDFIKNITPTEIGIITAIFVLLFGAKLVVKLARTSGETVKEVKNIKKEFIKTISGDDKKSSKS